MDSALIWTDELLQRLQAAGLRVTPNMMGQDVKMGYLPPPQVQSRSPVRGRTGQWDHLAVRRAFYLYRLRQRGAQGDVLRILLFLRDGWGWDGKHGIHPICLVGMKKLVEGLHSEVRDHIYKTKTKPVTPEVLSAIADYISEDVDIKHLEIGRFILGMGMFGKPVEGGSLQSLGELISQSFHLGTPFPARLAALIEQMEQRMVSSGLTWERMIQVVTETNAQQADQARRNLLQTAGLLRLLINRLCDEEATHPCPSNLLTLGGRSTREIAPEFRSLRERITPGQLLGAAIGIATIEQTIPMGISADLYEGDIG